jgi:hypothetical protein
MRQNGALQHTQLPYRDARIPAQETLLCSCPWQLDWYREDREATARQPRERPRQQQRLHRPSRGQAQTRAWRGERGGPAAARAGAQGSRLSKWQGRAVLANFPHANILSCQAPSVPTQKGQGVAWKDSA